MQLTYVCKAGWLLKRGKFGWRWIKRWYSLNSLERSLVYAAEAKQAKSKARAVLPGSIARVTSIAKPCHCDNTWVHGFILKSTTGAERRLYCESADDRDSWVWYLERLISGQVDIAERYQVEWNNVIGSGAYADVLKAHDTLSGEAVAVKVVSRFACQQYAALMQKEVAVMQRIDRHPHLLSLREVFCSEHHMYIITDLVPGGDLHGAAISAKGTAVRRFSEQEASQVVRQLLKALAFLHRRGIAHCDVKPENILLSSRRDLNGIKLIDYNSAVYCNELTEPGGTPEYIAPELLCDQAKQGMGPGLDMWAVGVLTYWLICGYTPFASDSIPGVLLNILNGSFVWPAHVELSNGAQNVIESLLRRRPEERPSAQQLLNHPWVKECPAAQQESPIVQPAACCSAYELHGRIHGRKCVDADYMSISTPQSSAASESREEGLNAPHQAVSLASLSLQSKLSIRVAARPGAARPRLSLEGASSQECTSKMGNDCPFAEEGAVMELVSYEETACELEEESGEIAESSRGTPLDSCMSIYEDQPPLPKAASRLACFGCNRPSCTCISS